MKPSNHLSWIALLTLGGLALGCGNGGSPSGSGGAGHPGAGGGGASTGSSSDGGANGTSSSSTSSSGSSLRGVENPQVMFEGTELDLSGQYGLYIQDPNGDIEITTDSLGIEGQVIHFTESKQADWEHVMVRPMDKRSNYQDVAQVKQYEKAYHVKERVQVPSDPQYTKIGSFNLLEDYHCEPCEANSLQLVVGYDNDDSLCVWMAYSTDVGFDPRGLARGSNFDPWPTLSQNRFYPQHDGEGYFSVPNAPPTASLLLCRDDLHVSDLQGRWVDFELLMRPSSYDTGVMRMWIDDKPYFYLGANNYRWNQEGVTDTSYPVNVFQIGIYGAANAPMNGTPSFWELYATPPRIEIGDDVVYSP